MQRFAVCFWDIIGELNNPELIPAFFKNVIGAIYVFDLTNEETLNNLKLWKEKI
jgi:GTPase SAR1 family protein